MYRFSLVYSCDLAKYREAELDSKQLRRLFFSFLIAIVIAVFVVCVFRIVNIYLYPSDNHPSLHMPKSLGG